MSGNSWARAFRRRRSSATSAAWTDPPPMTPRALVRRARLRAARPRWVSPGSPSALVEGQLVLADLQLIALVELLGLDPLAIDVGPVEGTEVVEMPAVAEADQQCMVS